MDIRKQVSDFVMWHGFQPTYKKVFGLFEVYQK